MALLIKEQKKYLLCRPSGGLNDTLNQIQKCFIYSKKFNRRLILDTKNSTFSDDWNHYFEMIDPTSDLLFYNNALGLELNSLSCFPKPLTGRITEYKTKLSVDKKKIIDCESKAIISFDFNKKYQEDLVVHHQCGGGNQSFKAIQLFKLTPEISLMIKNILKLNDKYVSIHIRNTDLKTTKDFRKTLRKLAAKEPLSKIFLATDSYECQNFAKNLFKDRLLLFFEIPDLGNYPLHYSSSKDLPIYKRNMFSIIDLVLLAKGTKLYNCNYNIINAAIYLTKKVILRMHPPKMISGFSRLAKFLHDNPKVLRKLIDGI